MNLSEKHLSFVCPMKRDDMLATDDGFLCNRCQETVYDLTDCSIEEAIGLQKKKRKKICAAVRVGSALAAAGLTASCQNTKSTDSDRGAPDQGKGPATTTNETGPIALGFMCPIENLSKEAAE